MEEFDLQYPQARADLKLLEELYNLETHREGRTKVWTWAGLDPDYVDVATVAALELGAISMDVFRDTPYGEAIERLISYCRQRVPQPHRTRLDRLSSAIHLRRHWLPRDPERVLEHLEDCLNQLYVSDPGWLFSRYERSDGEIGTYLLLPRHLVWYQGRIWLLALHEDTLKLFDLAGFVELERYRAAEHGVEPLRAETTDAGADDEGADLPTHPAEFDGERLAEYLSQYDRDPESYFEDAFGIYGGEGPVESVHVEVRGAWQRYLERYKLHPSQELMREESSLHVRLEIGICPELESFLLGMIPDVRIHEPDWLRAKLRDRVEQWLGGSPEG